MAEKTKEQRLAEQCPAVLTNNAVIQVGTQVVRITFMEQFIDAVEPRSCIVMATADALGFYRILGELLAQLPKETVLH